MDQTIYEDALLKKVRSTAPSNIAAAQITPLVGKTLEMIVRLARIKRVIEIGTLVGYSTIWLGRALPSDGLIVTIERSPEAHSLAQVNLGRANFPVQALCGDALTIIPQLSDDFDAVFIDGQKSQYLEYLALADQILAPGGIIIADNTLSFASNSSQARNRFTKAWAVIKEFNREIADKNRFTSLLLPIASGLTIAIKN